MLLACSSDSGTPRAPADSKRTAGLGAEVQNLAAFAAKVPTRSPQEAGERVWKLARLLDASVKESRFVGAAITAGSGKPWHAVGDGSQKLTAIYSPANDRMVVANGDLLPFRDDAPADLGSAVVLFRAGQAVKQLEASGLIGLGDFNAKTADVAPAWSGGGWSNDPASVTWQVVGYMVVMLRELNGIPFYNRRLTLHFRRDGAIAAVSLYGPIVESTKAGATEIPTASGFTFAQKVSDAAIDGRHAQTAPERAEAGAPALMYFLPLETAGGIAEPLRVFSYTPRFSDGKRTSLARRQTVGYSLRDPNAPPVFATPEEPEAEGDVRP